MAPFAGYHMPIQYSGINEEHENVRNQVGIFDVSHMGEFFVKGPDALGLIQRVTTNDASTLYIGQVQYSCMTNERGGIIDDLLVYRLDLEIYMLVVNASNIEKDWNWLVDNNYKNAELIDRSDELSLISVQGPYAVDTLQRLTSYQLSLIPYYHFRELMLNGIPGMIVSNTGYTGAGGFELYVPNHSAVALWEAIMTAGSYFHIRPVGLGARDTLRLEMGYCLYGNDIDDHATPLEAGLGWITKFNKEFNGKEVLQEQKSAGAKLKLVGIRMTERGIPRHGYRILNTHGEPIGAITSGTQSPTLKTGIALGYVSINAAAPGTHVLVDIRGQLLGACISKMPFVQSQIK
ncbi:MAG: Aminomethyltransferase [Mucilaginibacter sp.]|nr:Aminomethyltransferase [Mucilaginibacter sp.]